MGKFKYARVATRDVYEEYTSQLATNGHLNNGHVTNGQLESFRKEDILQWFLHSPGIDAAWVLNRVLEASPHLFTNLLDKNTRRCSVNDMVSMPTTPYKQRTQRKKIEGQMPGLPIVQFSSSVFYAEEGVDEVMVLDVMRIGNQEVTSEVSYETQDDSAMSGRSYVATFGRLVFEPGVSLLQIEVPIIDNALWDTTTEFKCILKDEGLTGAILGKYLYHTRVKIIDNDTFPTDDFPDLTTPQKVAECHKWPLLFGYFRMVSCIPSVWPGTVKYVIIDMVHNLWHLLNLFMTAYILDFIIDTSSPTSAMFLIHDRHQSLLVCALLTLLAVALKHYLDYKRLSLPIARPARNFVQNALLRKFLNYKTVVRESLPSGSVMMGMQRDAVELVDFGYFNMLRVYCTAGELLCVLGFQLIAPLLFVGRNNWPILVLVCVVPLVMVLFLRARENATSKTFHERNLLLTDFTCQIEATVTNHHLVIDYSLRNHIEYKFLEKQKLYGSAARKAQQILENNEYFCKWCQSLIIAFWLVYGGLQVIDGSLTVGLFVTSMKLFEKLTDAFMQLHSHAVHMMNTFPALENVTTLMNLSTDVQHRYRLKRAQRAEAKKSRESLRESMAKSNSNAVPIDLIPIKLNFQCPFKFEGKPAMLNFNGHVEIHQGQLVAVVGPLGCGKATLLRLIVGSVLPADGAASPIFVPSHLRMANVADEPLFLVGSLYDNLTFGMDTTQPDASTERVKAICRQLTRSHTITDFLDIDLTQAWQDVFSGAQCKLLSIARALVHNDELLCIHKPLARLTHDDAEHVIQALHAHVDNKGLELTDDPRRRRPRTVIVSAGSDRAVEEANNVITVDPLSGIALLFPD